MSVHNNNLLFQQPDNGDQRPAKRENPHKYLLYKPNINQLIVFLSSGFKELPPNGVLLLYMSADGCFTNIKHPEDGETLICLLPAIFIIFIYVFCEQFLYFLSLSCSLHFSFCISLSLLLIIYDILHKFFCAIICWYIYFILLIEFVFFLILLLNPRKFTKGNSQILQVSQQLI